MRHRTKSWIGWAGLAVGVCAVGSSIALTSTRAAAGLTFGFGALIVFFALLSLLARNRTPDHWGLFVAGFVMFLLPWLVGGFAPDRGAAWTAWVTGFLAMALGAVGWLTGGPPTETGIREYGAPGTERGALGYWISGAALVVGILTVVVATAVPSTSAAIAVTVGLGGLTAVIALWSLLAIDPTHDYLTLAVAGFALFLGPWIAGFTNDNAAWTAWVSGATATALGVTGYLRGEFLDFATTVHDNAEARYRRRFRLTQDTAPSRP